MKEHLALIRGIRFSPSQWSRILEYAHDCGLSPSTYVRKTALKAVPPQRRRAREREVAYHLGRVGNNLNQLARRHNSNEPVARSEVLAVLDELRAILRTL